MSARLPPKASKLAATALFGPAALLLLLVASLVATTEATRPEPEGPVAFRVARDGKTILKESLQHPSKFAEQPSIVKGDVLGLSFKLKDAETATDKSKGSPHQVFFFLTNTNDTDAWAVRFIPRTAGGSYKLDLDTRNLPDEVFAKSGECRLEIVLAGFQYDEGLVYTLGSAQVMGQASGGASAGRPYTYGPLPEIRHQFRGSQKMVSPFVSYVFVAVVLSPWLWLLASWRYLGVNLDRFSGSLSTMVPAIGFFCSLCGIMVAIFSYWISVTLFPTLTYVSILGLLAAVSGRHMLANMARVRLGLTSS